MDISGQGGKVRATMTQNNTIIRALVGLICLGAVAALVLSVRLYIGSHDLQDQQGAIVTINNHGRLAQSLMAELIEQSKKDPGIDPLLVQLGAKTNTPAATPPSRAPAR
jgi:hypothetical protein